MPTIANANGQLEVADTFSPQSEPLARASDVAPQPEPQPRIGYMPLEKLVFEGLSDDPHALTSWAADAATSLAGSDHDGARLRFVSRLLAAERSRMIVLQAILDRHLVEKNWFAAREISRVLRGTSDNVCRLIRDHAAASSIGRRAAILVGHADAIHIKAGK